MIFLSRILITVLMLAQNVVAGEPEAPACSVVVTTSDVVTTVDLKESVARITGLNGNLVPHLLRELSKINDEENLVVSPFNILNAVQLLYPGATAETATEMANALGIHGIELADFLADFAAVKRALTAPIDVRGQTQMTTLNLGSLLYANNRAGFEFDANYVNLAKRAFGATAAAMDFADPASLGRINADVAAATENLIPKMLPALAPKVVSVLISTLFIKGAWKNVFEPYSTLPGEFTRLDGSKITVPLMKQNNRFFYGENADMQVVRLPTQDGKAYMEVVLPKTLENSQAVREALVLNGDQKIALSQQKIMLALPRFEVSWGGSLRDIIKGIIPSAFEDESGFSKLGSSRLIVSDVIHKTAIQVNEGGFRAAAATAVTLEGAESVEMPPMITMIVNHSFGLRIVAYASGQEIELFRSWVNSPEPTPAPENDSF